MSLRNKINENPVIPVVGVIIALAVCGYFIWDMISGSRPGDYTNWVAYYTIDDGKTVFADKRPPNQLFKKDGKDAYLAIVFTCDDNKTQFVQCVIKKVEEQFSIPGSTEKLTRFVNYIKKPGDTEWVNESSFGKWSAIENPPRCKDGSEAVMVTPVGLNKGNTAQKGGGKGQNKAPEAQ